MLSKAKHPRIPFRTEERAYAIPSPLPVHCTQKMGSSSVEKISPITAQQPHTTLPENDMLTAPGPSVDGKWLPYQPTHNAPQK